MNLYVVFMSSYHNTDTLQAKKNKAERESRKRNQEKGIKKGNQDTNKRIKKQTNQSERESSTVSAFLDRAVLVCVVSDNAFFVISLTEVRFCLRKTGS